MIPELIHFTPLSSSYTDTDSLLPEPPWLALNIGNSRLHWGLFGHDKLNLTWEQPHIDDFSASTATPTRDRYREQLSAGYHLDLNLRELPELWVASVVPEQTAFWQHYPQVHLVALEQIPLKATYPTLGIDRALALWGAGMGYGWPVLVIDGGTALTLTGADSGGALVGGAILPGLGLQLQALQHKTSALPQVSLPEQLPPRWATQTNTAIQSGIVYTLLAGIQQFVEAWWQQWPDSSILITGGDRTRLHHYLKLWLTQQSLTPPWMNQMVEDQHLILKGVRSLRQVLTHLDESI